jgi:hypothetical protein
MVRRLRVERVGLTALVFIALIAALIGLILGGHSAASAATLPEQPPATYTYDGPRASIADEYTHYDRGPPSAHVDLHNHDADDPGSRGTSARAAGVLTATKYTYDIAVQFLSAACGDCLKGVTANTAIEGYARAADGAISSSASAGVAAKTGVALSKPSSRVLGASLEGAGFTRPAGSAAHHIVAGGSRSSSSAREVLQRFGIDINDAGNGVFLPGRMTSPNSAEAAVHSRIHTDAYYGEVNRLLGQATTRSEALDSLGYIRSQLLSGGFP